MKILKTSRPVLQRTSAFTLVEMVMSLAITAMTIGAIIYGYLLSANRAEWSAYSLAANSLALQELERARATPWKVGEIPDRLMAMNNTTNVGDLDVLVSGGRVKATNYTTVTEVSANPPLRMIKVKCVWHFINRGVFTNTLTTYRAASR